MSKKTLNLTFTRSAPSSKSSKTPNSTEDRQRIEQKFVNLLDSDVGSQCEEALYSKLCHQLGRDFPDKTFRREYLATAFNILQNLDPEGIVGNTYLLPKVQSGDISPQQLVTLSDQELYPPKWQKVKDQRLKEIKDQNDMKLTTTDLYKCGKCGKRETTFYQLQTRSMDEPTTSFINCVNCGNRWKD